MFKKFVFLLTALFLLAQQDTAQAAITLTKVNATPRILQPDRAARVSLSWHIRTTGGVAVTVDVDDGLFFIGGALQPETINALPSQTKTAGGPPPNFYTFTFTETITVPLALVKRAVALGQPLVFQRSFSDDAFATNTTVDAVLNFGSGLGGPLDVSRLRLAFGDGSTLCNAKTGEDVIVTAFVETEGSGTLRGNWQVRENATTGNFRTLKTVQIPVPAGKNVAVKSPPIPVSSNGRFDVRLKITSPALGFDEPFVSCAVSGSDKHLTKYVPQGTPVEVLSPRPFTPLGRNTKVEWKPLEGAKAYRIEILAEKDGEPVAAQEAKGDSLTNTLSPVTLEKLDPQRRYIVRVLAQ